MKRPLFEQEQARILAEKNHEKQQDGATKKACSKFEWRVSVTGKISLSIADIEESGTRRSLDLIGPIGPRQQNELW